jgi:hypothetical protein
MLNEGETLTIATETVLAQMNDFFGPRLEIHCQSRNLGT